MAKSKINRKVIVSFLSGSLRAGSYYPSHAPSQTITCSSEQEAMVEFLAKDWNSDDLFLLVATQEANSEDVAQSVRACFDGQLQTLIVPIPERNAQVYELLDTIMDELEERDQLFLHCDTHFGLLPAFTNTLVHYAKSLKNVRIGGIYTMMQQGDDVEIINLGSNEQLESWINAVDIFLKDGNSTLLQILIQKINPNLAALFSTFNAAMGTVRGWELCYEFDFEALKLGLAELEVPEIGAQVKPLLARVAQKFNGFSNNSTANGIAAAVWCQQFGLVQQGYTFLQETLKSHLIDKIFEAEAENMRIVFTVRELANEALKGKKHTDLRAEIMASKSRNIPFVALNKLPQICQWAKDSDLISVYTLIGGQGGLRNDMRHGGISSHPNTAARLKGKLESFIARIKQVIEQN